MLSRKQDFISIRPTLFSTSDKSFLYELRVFTLCRSRSSALPRYTVQVFIKVEKRSWLDDEKSREFLITMWMSKVTLFMVFRQTRTNDAPLVSFAIYCCLGSLLMTNFMNVRFFQHFISLLWGPFTKLSLHMYATFILEVPDQPYSSAHC